MGSIQNNVRFHLVSDIKFAVTTEDLKKKFRFNLCFKIKPYNGLKLWRIHKFVREPMPIQEEERESFGKTCCKSETNTKTVINTFFLLNRKNRWRLKHKVQMILVVFKSRNSLLDYHDTIKKFNEKMTVQSIFDQVIQEFDNTEHWSIEMKKDFVNAPHWSIDKWISNLAKRRRQRKCFNINWILTMSTNLCLRTIQGHSVRIINPTLKDNVVLPENFIEYRIEVNSEPRLGSRRSQSQEGQTSCVFHFCESDLMIKITYGRRSSNGWKVYSVNLSISTAESSSCRSIMTLYGEKNGNTEKCIQNSINVSKYARKLLCGRWSFLGLGSEKKWYKTCSDKPDGNWDRTAEMMIL